MPEDFLRLVAFRDAAVASVRRFSNSSVNAERRFKHSACIPCSGVGIGGVDTGVTGGGNTDTECENPAADAPVTGRIPADGGVIPTDCRDEVLGGLEGNVNGARGFGGGGVLSGVPNKVDTGGLVTKEENAVGALNEARDGGAGTVGAGAGKGVTPNTGRDSPPPVGKRVEALGSGDSISSFLTDTLH